MDEDDTECWCGACVRCPLCRSYAVAPVTRPDLCSVPLFWECEDCFGRWHRYSAEANPRLHEMAAMFVRQEDAW